MPAKLDPDTVRLLRRYHKHGYSVAALCRAFDLSRPCVSNVVNFKTHKNVTQDEDLPPLAEIVTNRQPRMPNGTSKRAKKRPDAATMAQLLLSQRR